MLNNLLTITAGIALSIFFTACAGGPKAVPLGTKCPKQAKRMQASPVFYFDYGSAALDVNTQDAVKILAQKMACTTGKVRLEGHTDTSSSSAFNKALGLKRAAAVKEFVTSLGIESSLIEVITYGKENPLFKGTGPDIDAKNRCVVVVFEGLAD